METSAWLQEAATKSADLQGMLDHHQQVVLMQSHHLSDFCKSCLSSACSQLQVSRLHRLVAAVTRLTLRQRMQLVFEGYRCWQPCMLLRRGIRAVSAIKACVVVWMRVGRWQSSAAQSMKAGHPLRDLLHTCLLMHSSSCICCLMLRPWDCCS